MLALYAICTEPLTRGHSSRLHSLSVFLYQACRAIYNRLIPDQDNPHPVSEISLACSSSWASQSYSQVVLCSLSRRRQEEEQRQGSECLRHVPSLRLVTRRFYSALYADSAERSQVCRCEHAAGGSFALSHWRRTRFCHQARPPVSTVFNISCMGLVPFGCPQYLDSSDSTSSSLYQTSHAGMHTARCVAPQTTM